MLQMAALQCTGPTCILVQREYLSYTLWGVILKTAWLQLQAGNACISGPVSLLDQGGTVGAPGHHAVESHDADGLDSPEGCQHAQTGLFCGDALSHDQANSLLGHLHDAEQLPLQPT